MNASADWPTLSLRELATINYGKSPAAILTEDGDYPVVGTGGADRSGTDFLYDGDSIILGRKRTIARVHFAESKFWTIDTAYFLSDFRGNVPRWLYYFFLTLDFRKMNEAPGVPSLSRELLYKIEVPTPPKPEQTKIAEILSTVDRAIEQTEALIAKQQRLKTGLMQDLLTRGIDQHGNLRSKQTHEFKDSPLGRIPVEWEVKDFSESVQSAVDGPFGSNLKSEHYVAEPGVRVLRLGNIGIGEFLDRDKAWISTEHGWFLSRHSVNHLDLLVASLGDERHPYGRACLYTDAEHQAVVKADVFRIRCKPESYEHAFVIHLFNLPRWRQGLFALAQGVTRDRVNLTNLMRLLLPVPSLTEQTFIAKQIDSSTRATNDLRRELNKLRALKTALMQDLLTGRKRVTALLNETEVTG